jgi:hypothetical protein
MATQSVRHLFQNRLHGSRLIGYRSDSENNYLVIVTRFNFSSGHVKPAPQAFQNTADHLPLVLQTLRLPQEQSHSQGADVHKCFQRSAGNIQPNIGRFWLAADR